jgi:hypothetical protein
MPISMQIQYSRRILAFVDILGFADTVRQSGKYASSMELVWELLDANSKFKELFDKVINGNGSARFAEANFFSDTFVLSMSDDKIIYVLREIGNLNRHLLLRGLPCRGAVVTGLLHHQDRYVVGPALVDAYRLEQNAAIHPRILLDDASLQLWRRETSKGSATEDVASIVKRDADGHHFLDIFDPAWTSFLNPYSDEVGWRPMSNFAKDAGPAIAVQLKHNTENTRVREKYEWLEAQRRRYI